MKKLLLMIILSISSLSFATENLFIEREFSKPLREISVIITEEGFYPNKLMAFEGEKVRFFITSTTKDKQCFILQKHKLFLGVDQGKVNEGELVLDQTGRFRFYCPTNKKEGYLTVLKKSGKVAEETSRGRAPASVVTKPTFWTPRENDIEYEEY